MNLYFYKVCRDLFLLAGVISLSNGAVLAAGNCPNIPGNYTILQNQTYALCAGAQSVNFGEITYANCTIMPAALASQRRRLIPSLPQQIFRQQILYRAPLHREQYQQLIKMVLEKAATLSAHTANLTRLILLFIPVTQVATRNVTAVCVSQILQALPTIRFGEMLQRTK